MLRSLAASSSAARIAAMPRSAVASTSRAAGFATSASVRQAAPAPPKMIKLTVDGKEVEVEQG